MASEKDARPKLSDVEQFTNILQRKRDELVSAMYFQELLEDAEDIFLRHPLTIPETAPLTDERAVIAALGTRGLKVALEFGAGFMRDYIEDDVYTTEEEESAAEYAINPLAPLRFPLFFNGPSTAETLTKVEAFGAQLIDESFKTLGQDAYEKADAFKAATTAKEQLAIMQWLDARLRTMASAPLRETTSAVKEYHPARLSPKLIGTYPDITLPPTCLSVSVIATGFFKRAGVEEILHADVVRTTTEDLAMYTRALIQNIPRLVEPLGISLSNPLLESMENIRTQVSNYEQRLEAHHSAVYIKLVDGTWAQFDSNYHSTIQIEPVDDDTLDLEHSWDLLSSMSAIAPNLEMLTPLDKSSHFDIPGMSYLILKEQSPETIERLSLAVQNELDVDSDESLGERIYQHIEAIFFDDTDENPNALLASLNGVIKSYDVVDFNSNGEQHLRNVFHHLFTKYVLWNEDPREVLKKIRTNEQYRANRIEDIKALPVLMLLLMSLDSFKEAPYTPSVHRTVEVGLPEQRIGMSVLSDLATYSDSPLPAAFWLNHWPGGVPVIEQLDRASDSSSDDSYLTNNLIHYEQHPLTSHRNYSIIKRFIEVRSQ